jgi:hypothetical protein
MVLPIKSVSLVAFLAWPLAVLAQEHSGYPEGKLFLTMHIEEDNQSIKSVQTFCSGTLVDPSTVLAHASCVEPILLAKKEKRGAKLAPSLSRFVIDIDEDEHLQAFSPLLPYVVYHPSLEGESSSQIPYVLLFLSQGIQLNDYRQDGFLPMEDMREWIEGEKTHQTAFFRRSNDRKNELWSRKEIWNHPIFRDDREATPEIKDEKAPKRDKDRRALLRKISSSSWDFSDQILISPDNAAHNHKRWGVVCDTPGALHLSQTVELDELVVDHEAFRLSIPESYKNGKTEKKMLKKWDKLIKKKQFGEAIELKDHLMGAYEDGSARIKGILESKKILIKKGMIDVWGEIHTLDMDVMGGFLVGYGKIIAAQNGLRNSGGVVAPGYFNQFLTGDGPTADQDLESGALEIVGDYTQTGYDETPGTLRFYISEDKKKNRVSDKMRVIGKANLDGNLQIFVKPGLDLHGETFILLDASAGISGEFARVEVSSGSKITYIPKFQYDGSRLQVTFYDRKKQQREEVGFGSKLYPKILSHQKVSFSEDRLKPFRQIFLQGGGFHGEGSLKVSGEFFNCGELMIGNKKDPGLLRIHGHYRQCESSDPERYPALGGNLILTASQAGADQLEVSGQATLGGMLTIIAQDPLALRGKKLEFVRAQEIRGQFSKILVLNTKLIGYPTYHPDRLEIEFRSERIQDVVKDMDPETQKVIQLIDDLADSGKVTPQKPILSLIRAGIHLDEEFLSALPYLKAQMDLNKQTEDKLSHYQRSFEELGHPELEEAFLVLHGEYKKALSDECLAFLKIKKQGYTEENEHKMVLSQEESSRKKDALDEFLKIHGKPT